MAINVFDQAARYCIQSDPLGFLRWLVRGLDLALKFFGSLDTRTLPFPGTPDRICDTVADLAEDAASDHRWAVISEFQTDPETEILDRALEYVVRDRRGLRFGPHRRRTVPGRRGTGQPDWPGQVRHSQNGTTRLRLPGPSLLRRRAHPPATKMPPSASTDRRRDHLTVPPLVDFADAWRRHTGYHRTLECVE